MHTNRIKLQITSIVCIIICNFSQAQTHIINQTSIDSARFSQTRNILNNLSVNGFEKKVFTNGNVNIPYRFLLPKGFDLSKKYPLVITFHNSSRIGNDNENQLEHLARTWIRDDIFNKFSCFVLAPQFTQRSSTYVQDAEGILTSFPSNDAVQILALIKKIEQDYPNIDLGRIYLIGYSMGASTAQNLLSLAPEKFAAMVSIAAVPDLSNLDHLRHKDIWLIHGEKDIDNPYIGSKVLYKKLNGNSKLVFTTFKNLQHNNIVIPYLLTDELQKWLFSKHL
ncbi:MULTISPECIES: alpha/beta fold hydrolase [Sphingobacterium]|uniref:AB hydrolase-1 domain-containing protein n=1 Tax=Sphingobacterium ginsenosidimutans TaxID=687845 RepID=A0ABP8A4V5_9SPHI|nr:alpha/beta fold hydrolase [Sphingobacterium sp. E70]ULT24824.1 alpha/beta fold hydrolase [Sphingobacterium sp. E70]